MYIVQKYREGMRRSGNQEVSKYFVRDNYYGSTNQFTGWDQ